MLATEKSSIDTSLVHASYVIITRGVLIYWIGKISAADMAKFAISEISFEIVQIYIPIFTHALIFQCTV